MRKISIYIVIIVAILVVIIGLAAYATLTPIVNIENMNTNTYLGGQVSLTTSGGGVISGNISSLAMSQGNANNTIELGNAILNVTMTSSNDKGICCSYDIIWEWDQTNVTTNQYSLTTGAIKEYTLSGSYDEYYGNANADTLSGTSVGSFEHQLQDYNVSALSASMTKTTICNNPNTASKVRTQSWNLKTNFYNLNLNQDAFKNATFTGKAKVANVSCAVQKILANYLVNDAPRSGTDAVSNSPWVLTSDRAGEWRYAGKNPDNYIQFNGELWRIIGVMPTTYCTGEYGNVNECDISTTGSLVKIIRNDSLGSFSYDYKNNYVGSSISDYGSNEWTDSQLMLMLNGDKYLKTGYDRFNNQLHTEYDISQGVVRDTDGNGFYNVSYNYLDGNGTTLYAPASVTYGSEYTITEATVSKKIDVSALEHIATVKWDLYGASNNSLIDSGTSPGTWYDIERGLNGLGTVYDIEPLNERRAVYWYGKVGLTYPSDYGYATNGNGNSSGDYSRNWCVLSQMDDWTEGDYFTYCVGNDWLRYTNTISSPPTNPTGSTRAITPYSGYHRSAYAIIATGQVDSSMVRIANAIRPVLYLKTDTIITGGNGTWSNPYTIEKKHYWFTSTTGSGNGIRHFPDYGGTLQSSGNDTGKTVYVGQDSSKYYTCATIQNKEVCLSQPYTQYGLEGVTAYTFTSEQEESAKQAVYQAFINAGIDIDINNDCFVNNGSGCRVGNTYCTVYSNHNVICADDSEYTSCSVWPENSSGAAMCEYTYD